MSTCVGDERIMKRLATFGFLTEIKVFKLEMELTMNLRVGLSTAVVLTGLFLTGCKTATVKPAVPLSDNIGSVKYIVPKTSDIVSGYKFIEDINFRGFKRGPREAQEILSFTKLSDDKLEIHRRTQNVSVQGVSPGSGIKYTVDYAVSEMPESYSVTLKPVASDAYQEGLIGKFDVPSYTPQQVLETLKTGTVFYSLEIDSPYGMESITSNFDRLAKRDELNRRYIMNRGQKVYFELKAVPYRNGTKVNLTVVAPAAETSASTIDFGMIRNEVLGALKKIVLA